MTDICDISRVAGCIAAGAHEPLSLPGDGDDENGTSVGLVNAPTDIQWGKVFFCKRCGLLYWEPIEKDES